MILSLQMACQTEHALLLIYRKFLHVLSNTAPAYLKETVHWYGFSLQVPVYYWMPPNHNTQNHMHT